MSIMIKTAIPYNNIFSGFQIEDQEDDPIEEDTYPLTAAWSELFTKLYRNQTLHLLNFIVYSKTLLHFLNNDPVKHTLFIDSMLYIPKQSVYNFVSDHASSWYSADTDSTFKDNNIACSYILTKLLTTPLNSYVQLPALRKTFSVMEIGGSKSISNDISRMELLVRCPRRLNLANEEDYSDVVNVDFDTYMTCIAPCNMTMLTSDDLAMIDHIATLSKHSRCTDTRLKIYLLKLFNQIETLLSELESKVILSKSVSTFMFEMKSSLFNDMIATCRVKAPIKNTFATIWTTELSTWMDYRTIFTCNEEYYYPELSHTQW